MVLETAQLDGLASFAIRVAIGAGSYWRRAASTFDTRTGTEFFGWDVSSNFSVYPSELLTVRLEVSHHEASVPVPRDQAESLDPMAASAAVCIIPTGDLNLCAIWLDS